MNARQVACVALALSFLGCGGRSGDPNRPKTVPVTGTVTHQGRAVEGATITFITSSPAGRGAIGKTDAAGKFTMTTFDPGDGVIPGSYRVTVSKTVMGPKVATGIPGEPPQEKEMDLLPVKYKSEQTSDLTAVVKEGGDNEFTFALTD